jgi:hypothetical protein
VAKSSTSASPAWSCSEWNQSGQCALVVGATFPAEIARVRELTGNMPLLVPGIGAQGGDIEATVRAGCTATGDGLLINSSRAILYAGNGEDFADAARRVAMATRDAINTYRRAFVSMKLRRGSTSSPMRVVKISSAPMASSICTLSRSTHLGVHGRFPELRGIHFTEPLVTLLGDASLDFAEQPLHGFGKTA